MTVTFTCDAGHEIAFTDDGRPSDEFDYTIARTRRELADGCNAQGPRGGRCRRRVTESRQ